MATVSATKDEIKPDVRELANIAIADKISRHTIKDYLNLAEMHYKEALEERLRQDLLISDITGINKVTSKFADKLLFVLSKYQQNEERRLIVHCISLMVDQASKN